MGQLRELHDGQAVTSVALALHAPAAAGRHDKLAFCAAHGRVALDVARAGADEGEENAGACGRGGEGDGGGAGARHAPLLPMKFGCSSTLMLAAVLVTVHHITSSPSSNACDSCSSPFFTPRYSALLLGGIFSSAVMSSFRYLRHASHWLPLMGGGGKGGVRV